MNENVITTLQERRNFSSFVKQFPSYPTCVLLSTEVVVYDNY